MGIRYFKLFDLLNRRGMTKTELKENIGISTATLAKLNKGENINSDTINRICAFLNVQPGDIMEYIADTDTGETL